MAERSRDGTNEHRRDAAGIERSRLALLWWVVFLVSQLVALVAVLALDPAGFDQCDAAPAGPRPLQASIAGVALLGALALAGRRLRGRHLVVAWAAVALSAVAWMWLLAGSQEC